MIFICAFGLSLLAVLALTPAVRTLATKLRFLDYPNRAKAHRRPTPLMGGLAVAIASLAAAASALALIRCPYSARIVGFMSGGLIVVVLGLADDANGMRPRVKLAGQAAAATVMLLSGGIDGIPLPTPLAFAFALLWMVGLMNAFNFLDNMDGITSGLASIASFGIFTLALGNGHIHTAIAAISVAGGALGFLRYNFSPASIFLGDAGSLFLGYVVGGLSLRAVSYGGADPTALLIPVLMLGYPIFDATLVTIARLVDGRDVAQGGTDHSSHRLARLGLSAPQTARTIYTISALLTASAVYLALYHDGRTGLLSLAALAAAGGMVFLGLRLLRVPVPGRSEQVARSVRILKDLSEEELQLLSGRSRPEPSHAAASEPAETKTRETVTTR